MKKKIKIREGSTGILYITDENGEEDRFVPDCDLKETNRLLQEFYELRSDDGKNIKGSFWDDGINWFPTIIALLHWHIIYAYIKYKNFLKKYPIHRYNYILLNNGRLAEFLRLVLLYEGKHLNDSLIINLKSEVIFKVKYLKSLIRYIVASFYNKRVFRYYPQNPVLLYRCGVVDDFRTSQVIKILSDMGINYIELGGLKIKQLIQTLFIRRPLPNILFAEKASFNSNYKSFIISEDVDPMLRRVFQLGIFIIQDKIKSFQSAYRLFKKQLKNSPFEILYGIDDTNSIYPVLYACQANGIKTVGHQHGANYSLWDAPYALNGFKQGEYRWFDRILVWGEWWKRHILAKTPCLSADGQIMVGAPMRPLLQPKTQNACGKQGTMGILIPHEDLADTYHVGKYICALQDLGYAIYFKWRLDGKLEDQLEAYCLPRGNKEKLIIVKEITDEVMSKIDIIAGTYSTVIFELLPYMKEIWIFETKFIFWDCLVEEGIAKKIRLHNIKEDIAKSSNMPDEKTINSFFSKESLKDVLEKELKALA